MASGQNSAGTADARVDRPDEGLPGLATQATLGYPLNATANPPTRGTFDAGEARGLINSKPAANIDTSGTSGLTPDADLKRGTPSAWT
jgi:hypothetical protein